MGFGLVALVGLQDGERPPLERHGILELTLPEPADVRSEWFRLDAPEGDAPIGLVRLDRILGAGGGLRLECETLFFDVATRVRHVERLEDDALDLIWREVGSRHGRTVHVQWDRAVEGLEVADTSGGEVHRRRLDASRGALTPLYLLEKLRAGHLSSGNFERISPNSATVESLAHEIGIAPAPLLERGRMHTWRRADGSLAGRYVLAGLALLAYQLQEGGPVARAVSEADYLALRRLHWSGAGNR